MAESLQEVMARKKREVNGLKIELDLLQTLQNIHTRMDRLQAMMKNPKRWARSRIVFQVPGFCLAMRRRFRPYWRWVKRDKSMIEFGMLGLVGLLSLPARKGDPLVKGVTHGNHPQPG